MIDYQDETNKLFDKLAKTYPELAQILSVLAQGMQNHEIRIAKLEHETKEAYR